MVRCLFRVVWICHLGRNIKKEWPPKGAAIRAAGPTAPRLLQESNPTETQQRLESRCGSGIACGKRGRRKDEYEHVICQQAVTTHSESSFFVSFTIRNFGLIDSLLNASSTVFSLAIRICCGSPLAVVPMQYMFDS